MASLSLNSNHPASLRSSIIWLLSSAVNWWVPADYEKNTFNTWNVEVWLNSNTCTALYVEIQKKVLRTMISNHLWFLHSENTKFSKRDKNKTSSVQNKLPPWYVSLSPLTNASNFTIQLSWFLTDKVKFDYLDILPKITTNGQHSRT